MPNFRAIGQSVWKKNGNRQTETQKDRQTHLNFIKIDIDFKQIYIASEASFSTEGCDQ